MTDPRWQTVREALGQFSFQATNPYLADEALAALDSLEAEAERLRDLLRRIDQWDHMDTAADGPYWRREIRAALGGEE